MVTTETVTMMRVRKGPVVVVTTVIAGDSDSDKGNSDSDNTSGEH